MLETSKISRQRQAGSGELGELDENHRRFKVSLQDCVSQMDPTFGREKILCRGVQNSSDGNFAQTCSCEGRGKEQWCSAGGLHKTLVRRTWFEGDILVMA